MPDQTHRPWSDEDKARLAEWWGLRPTEEIAADLGRGIQAVRLKAHRILGTTANEADHGAA